MAPLADFMVRMKKLDDIGLQPIDVVFLGIVSLQPGLMGREVGGVLGYGGRRRDRMTKLLREGFIEDRREIKEARIPNRYYATAKGVALLKEMLDPL